MLNFKINIKKKKKIREFSWAGSFLSDILQTAFQIIVDVPEDLTKKVELQLLSQYLFFLML